MYGKDGRPSLAIMIGSAIKKKNGGGGDMGANDEMEDENEDKDDGEDMQAGLESAMEDFEGAKSIPDKVAAMKSFIRMCKASDY